MSSSSAAARVPYSRRDADATARATGLDGKLSSACVERPWCSWCSTTQSCHGGGKHKASGELCLEWHELACPKLPLELVYEQPAFVRALMPCHATDSDPKAHPWDLALLETGGADC